MHFSSNCTDWRLFNTSSACTKHPVRLSTWPLDKFSSWAVHPHSVLLWKCLQGEIANFTVMYSLHTERHLLLTQHLIIVTNLNVGSRIYSCANICAHNTFYGQWNFNIRASKWTKKGHEQVEKHFTKIKAIGMGGTKSDQTRVDRKFWMLESWQQQAHAYFVFY